MKRSTLLLTGIIFITALNISYAMARKPQPAPQQQQNQQQAPPMPIYQCEYCKRSFQFPDNRLLILRVEGNQDHFICWRCFYEALDYAHKHMEQDHNAEIIPVPTPTPTKK